MSEVLLLDTTLLLSQWMLLSHSLLLLMLEWPYLPGPSEVGTVLLYIHSVRTYSLAKIEHSALYYRCDMQCMLYWYWSALQKKNSLVLRPIFPF